MTKKSKIASAILGAVAMVGAILGMNVLFSSDGGEIKLQVETKIDYADEEVPTLLETEDGEVEIIEAPTVEFVDSGKVNECPEESPECAKGAGNLPYLDITSPSTVYLSHRLSEKEPCCYSHPRYLPHGIHHN